jgi:pyridine nucleotide-disulfide oxidoreductase family protein
MMAPKVRELVLVGGGHAHVHVLKELALEPIPNSRVVLVTPYTRQLYSGMIPGYIAGHYSMNDCAIELPALARAANVELVQGRVQSLDAAASRVALENGETLPYDFISINSGPVLSVSTDSITIKGIANNDPRIVTVRPIEQFVVWWDAFAARAASEWRMQRRMPRIVIVGAGAAGVELAFAMRHKLGRGVSITLLSGGPPALAGHPTAVQARVSRALSHHGIDLRRQSCTAVTDTHAVTSSGEMLDCGPGDACVLALGTQAPQWLQESGLALDPQGFALVNSAQRSTSHAQVFAVGDVATRADTPHVKSGVFAVRAGAPLMRNLRRAFAGLPLAPYDIKQRTLNLLSCGDRYAIMSWGELSAEGAWVWQWKNWVDKRFMARYRSTA